MSFFTDALNRYYDTVTDDAEGRYRSWEHCYQQFTFARSKYADDKQVDLLSLHLAFYLASWGMYRGSSFLLQKSYQVHIPAVKIILSQRYDPLSGIACNQINDQTIHLIFDLSKKLEDYYDGVRKTVVKNFPKNVLSATLITKILMGTLGCVPAYDRYFCKGVKLTSISTSIYNAGSLKRLAKFYRTYECELEKVRETMKFEDLLYPQMKLIDMIFWQIGYENETIKPTKVM